MNNLYIIKSFRKRHKLSQSQAANALGYNLRTWQNYEQGNAKIPQHLIKHIEHYDSLQICQRGYNY